MGKITAMINLFRVGHAVSDNFAMRLKQGQITVNSIAALVTAIGMVASAFGHPIPFITSDFALAVGTVLLGLANGLLTPLSSKKVGLLPAKPNGAGVEDSGVGQHVPVQPEPVVVAKVRAGVAPPPPLEIHGEV